MSFSDPIPEASGNYVADHWRGDHMLGRAYWLNYVSIGSVTGLLVPGFVNALLGSNSSVQLSSIVILVMIALGLVLYVWGVVGVWRSAGHHAARGGTPAWAHVARLMIVIGLLALVARTYNTSAFYVETTKLAFGQDVLGDPAQVSIAGTNLAIVGPLSVGTAAKVRTALEENDRIATVTIDSIGGRFGEAMEIAKLIRARKLETIARGQCNSACTFVLLAGSKRSAMMQTNIGFHQPDYPGLAQSERRVMFDEQRDIFREAGMPEWFIDRTLEAPPEGMWSASESDMFRAGFLNQVSQARILDEVKLGAREVNAQSPMQLDEITSLEGATADGMQIIFRNRITLDRSQFNVGLMRTEMTARNRAAICANPDVKRMIEFGMSYRYDYVDSSRRPLVSVVVESC